MYARELERKLKKQNLGLWMHWRDAKPDYGKFGTVGLYWNKDYICACPLTDMPEKTVMDGQRIAARGWRDVLAVVHGQGYI